MKKDKIIYFISICLVLFVFFFLVSVSLIGNSVKTKCAIAKEKYSGNCTQALLSYLEDENNSFKSRNSAIWALGQIGDDESLPVLKKYHTEFKGERIDRNQELSQLELERAIGYMEGNANITTFFWRFGSPIE